MAISGYLKQSTAVTVPVGPFVDSTDGDSAETGLTISQADVRLKKNGGNAAQKNESSSLTHDEEGVYDCDLDATDTNTLGILTLFVHESGALHVRHDFMVMPANVWDSFFASDLLQVDLTSLNDLSAAEVNAQCDTALSDYDAPTKAEMDSGLAALNDLSAAEVNAEVVDVVRTDTTGEPGQGTPAESVSLSAKVDWIYKALINKWDNDGSFDQLYNYAGSVVDHKQTTSESSGTVTRDKMVSGP